MKANTLKRKLASGIPCVGTFITIPSPDVVEIAGVAGFDFVIIDLEHGLINLETMANMVRAADVHELAAIVRVPESSDDLLLSALESGAHGVEVPHIETKEDAEKAVQAVKYFPHGMRGVSPYTRAGWYSSINPQQHFTISNEETMVILQIEGRLGVENIRTIASVRGVDVLFAGPYDLSQSLGVPGAVDDANVLTAIKTIIQVCNEKGIWPGTFAPTVDKARQWIKTGMKYIAYSVDNGILFKAFQQSVTEIKKET